MLFAVPTFPSQNDITYNRDIVVKFYGLAAVGAMRGRRYN
jgi:hypothetical protein